MSGVVIDSQISSVNSNDITKSMDDWEVLKSLSIDDNLSEVVCLGLWVESWVNHLEGADESIRVNFIWESCVNYDTIEVA